MFKKWVQTIAIAVLSLGCLTAARADKALGE